MNTLVPHVMNIAIEITNPNPINSDCKLFRLDKPISYPSWGANKLTQETHYVVVSRRDIPGVHETYIFPADETGCILDWLELPGSQGEPCSHEEALGHAGINVLEVQ